MRRRRMDRGAKRGETMGSPDSLILKNESKRVWESVGKVLFHVIHNWRSSHLEEKCCV